MKISLSVLESRDFERSLNPLTNLLMNAVETGASLGFLSGNSREDFLEFWKSEFVDAQAAKTEIIVARDGEQIVGVVCLTSIGKANQIHRAEVRKLLVDRDYQGQGIATRLMKKLEEIAADRRKSLLTLDTETNSSADFLYQKLHWTRYGIVPNYAASPDGVLADCSFYFKALS